MTQRNLFVDFLATVFGIGAWVAINGLWVELPLLVQELPEGWNLPSYMSVVTQIANIGPLAYSILRFSHSSLKPVPIIYLILFIGCSSAIFLALIWDNTSIIGGVEHSTSLLTLVFFLALVDCTSSVLYIPYMAAWRCIYLPSYLIGEGLSGLLPALVALGQGAGGNGECKNITSGGGVTWISVSEDINPNFSVDIFFYFLFAMMVASSVAFCLLEMLPAIQSERAVNSESRISLANNSSTIMETTSTETTEKQPMSRKTLSFLFFIVAWACLLANGFLPSIQSYSCGPYGNVTYHLAATLSALANPLAAFSTMILPRAYPKKIGYLAVIGTILACYIFATAAMSPFPPLVGSTSGSILIVLMWVLFGGIITYVRVEIANLMREEGEKKLFWAGVVTQAGSAVGAVIAFILVNNANIFTPYQPCG